MQTIQAPAFYKNRIENCDFWGEEGDNGRSDVLFKTLELAVADAMIFLSDAAEEGLGYSLEDIEIVGFDAAGADIVVIRSPDFPVLAHLQTLGADEDGKALVWDAEQSKIVTLE